jgi:GT2 family glycosyltransferase
MATDQSGSGGRVSIIIPTRDRRAELAECLASIERQNYADREVIVVDDHSEDDTAAYVREHHPDATLIATEERRQPAHLRNLGLRAVSGEFVLFLDSDSELPRPDSLQTMVRTLESHPDVAILGGEIKARGGPRDRAFGRRVRFNGETAPVAASAETPDELVDCDYVATCNCFGRAQTMREAGGFDPYFGFGGEDVDFVVRASRGRRCCVSYATAVLHKQSPRGRNPDETRRYHASRVRQQFKNAPLGRALLGLAYDLARAAVFYVLLLPKLLVKAVRGERIRRENVTGGWLLVRAYVANARRLGRIRAARSADFLSDEQMTAFERTRAG